jgi:formyltetrahydrofolate deformylase
VQRYILTLRCPDQPGIVHALAAGVAEAKGNILESAQFSDPGTGIFTIRVSLETPDADTESLRDELSLRLARFDPVLTVRPEEQRRRVLLMVSKFDHCLVDLLYRWGLGELPVDIPLIVSNHPDLAPVAKRYGIPFVHVPVTRDTKPEAEAELLRLVAEHQVDFVVLARYMQVLSDDLCGKLSGRIINIHHSFLPAFAGARPYQQAFDRGVKIIGATAHIVTDDLDTGPIIAQDVRPVTHAHTAADMARAGRDVEKIVLAHALTLLLEERVFLSGDRAVVFE